MSHARTPYSGPFDCTYQPSHFTPSFVFKQEGGLDEIIPMAINFFRLYSFFIMTNDTFFEGLIVSLCSSVSHQKWAVVTGLIGVGHVFISPGTYIPRRQRIH